jgi:hypothetical protein
MALVLKLLTIVNFNHESFETKQLQDVAWF